MTPSAHDTLRGTCTPHIARTRPGTHSLSLLSPGFTGREPSLQNLRGARRTLAPFLAQRLAGSTSRGSYVIPCPQASSPQETEMEARHLLPGHPIWNSAFMHPIPSCHPRPSCRRPSRGRFQVSEVGHLPPLLIFKGFIAIITGTQQMAHIQI